jgi:hypothetical protein
MAGYNSLNYLIYGKIKQGAGGDFTEIAASQDVSGRWRQVESCLNRYNNSSYMREPGNCSIAFLPYSPDLWTYFEIIRRIEGPQSPTPNRGYDDVRATFITKQDLQRALSEGKAPFRAMFELHADHSTLPPVPDLPLFDRIIQDRNRLDFNHFLKPADVPFRESKYAKGTPIAAPFGVWSDYAPSGQRVEYNLRVLLIQMLSALANDQSVTVIYKQGWQDEFSLFTRLMIAESLQLLMRTLLPTTKSALAFALNYFTTTRLDILFVEKSEYSGTSGLPDSVVLNAGDALNSNPNMLPERQRAWLQELERIFSHSPDFATGIEHWQNIAPRLKTMSPMQVSIVTSLGLNHPALRAETRGNILQVAETTPTALDLDDWKEVLAHALEWASDPSDANGVEAALMRSSHAEGFFLYNRDDLGSPFPKLYELWSASGFKANLYPHLVKAAQKRRLPSPDFLVALYRDQPDRFEYLLQESIGNRLVFTDGTFLNLIIEDWPTWAGLFGQASGTLANALKPMALEALRQNHWRLALDIAAAAPNQLSDLALKFRENISVAEIGTLNAQQASTFFLACDAYYSTNNPRPLPVGSLEALRTRLTDSLKDLELLGKLLFYEIPLSPVGGEGRNQVASQIEDLLKIKVGRDAPSSPIAQDYRYLLERGSGMASRSLVGICRQNIRLAAAQPAMFQAFARVFINGERGGVFTLDDLDYLVKISKDGDLLRELLTNKARILPLQSELRPLLEIVNQLRNRGVLDTNSRKQFLGQVFQAYSTRLMQEQLLHLFVENWEATYRGEDFAYFCEWYKLQGLDDLVNFAAPGDKDKVVGLALEAYGSRSAKDDRPLRIGVASLIQSRQLVKYLPKLHDQKFAITPALWTELLSSHERTIAISDLFALVGAQQPSSSYADKLLSSAYKLTPDESADTVSELLKASYQALQNSDNLNIDLNRYASQLIHTDHEFKAGSLQTRLRCSQLCAQARRDLLALPADPLARRRGITLAAESLRYIKDVFMNYVQNLSLDPQLLKLMVRYAAAIDENLPPQIFTWLEKTYGPGERSALVSTLEDLLREVQSVNRSSAAAKTLDAWIMRLSNNRVSSQAEETVAARPAQLNARRTPPVRDPARSTGEYNVQEQKLVADAFMKEHEKKAPEEPAVKAQSFSFSGFMQGYLNLPDSNPVLAIVAIVGWVVLIFVTIKVLL